MRGGLVCSGCCPSLRWVELTLIAVKRSLALTASASTEGKLCEMQRSFVRIATDKADPMTDLPGHEQVLTTPSGNSEGRNEAM